MLYAFILGKNTALSVAEILSVLRRDRFVFVIHSITGNALIIKLDKRIGNSQDFLDKLGGTIKIAEIFTETQDKDIEGSMLGYVYNSFSESKFVFGISAYGLKAKNLGFDIKKKLKKANISSRFVQGKEESLSAPEIKNNKIIDKGADFVLIRIDHRILIGRTIAIQNYESYSHRDYDRPRRNAKSGMLPPKVAQVMLNLIPNDPKNITDLTIYDPFCGNGTVLQEALLMGYMVIGSDISNDRIYDTRENLKWLGDIYGLNINPTDMIFQADALNLDKENLLVKPDAIVSEVYLGPPLTDRTTEPEIKRIVRDLEEEYQQFLKSSSILNVPYIVLALPFYKVKNKIDSLNIIDEIKSIGYNVIDPFEKIGIGFNLLPEYDSIRKTIYYSRPDQIVGREIVILSKKRNGS